MKIFTSVDKNGDGSVTREELMHAIVQAAKPASSSDDKKPSDQPRGHRPGRDGRPGMRPGRFGPGGPGPHGPPSASALLERFDKDHKGSLTKSDVPERVWERISRADANKDGTVTKDELETFIKSHRPPQRDSKPAETPKKDEPQAPKAEDAKPTASNTEQERPADATTVSNVL